MKNYNILLNQDDGGYSGYCLEIPQAIGQGDTEDDAIEDVKKAIKLCLEYLADQKKDTSKRIISVSV